MFTLDIPALVAAHKLTFGDIRMEDAGGTGGATTTTDATATGAGADAAGAGTATGTATTADATTNGSASNEVKDLPEWAQNLIKDTRKEAGDYRTAAKTAADAATKELTDKLAEALGIKDPTDPAKLLEQAKASNEATTAELLGLKRQISARDAASKGGANAALLLDSASFRTALDALEPADKTFEANLERLVKTTLETQPHLKAARAAGASGVEMTGGSGEPTQITDPAVIKAMSAEERVDALNKGHLRAYMDS